MAVKNFVKGRSFDFLVINVCNHGEHYERPCIFCSNIYIYIYIYINVYIRLSNHEELKGWDILCGEYKCM